MNTNTNRFDYAKLYCPVLVLRAVRRPSEFFSTVLQLRAALNRQTPPLQRKADQPHHQRQFRSYQLNLHPQLKKSSIEKGKWEKSANRNTLLTWVVCTGTTAENDQYRAKAGLADRHTSAHAIKYYHIQNTDVDTSSTDQKDVCEHEIKDAAVCEHEIKDADIYLYMNRPRPALLSPESW